MDKKRNKDGVQGREGRQSTLYVVAYDIPDDKRRTQVHKVLKGFGTWTEYSLFECFLTKKELLQMRDKLNKHINGQRDKIRIYMICNSCLGKVETVGIPEPHEDTCYLI
jgi:CRISPR-associated protein Cas2